MKVSLNIIKQLINFELPPVDELVSRINQQLGGVEEVIDLKAKYDGAVIVRVVSCVDHENSDHLHVCFVDDGGVVPDVERNEQGLVQVVCGAPNVHADVWAIWLPPKSTVPASFDDDEPFVLDARKLRGVMSYGMLAAGDELAINSDHDGIIEITENDLPYDMNDRTLKAGMNFAATFGLDDTVIDIENKMFTHRPDCFGQLGVAREIAGIFGQQFTSPEWYTKLPEFTDAAGLELTTFNETNGKVSRAMFVAMDNIKIKPSPLWLQTALVVMGGKAINNVVDVTNYLMLMTAQPTHAYDYDKIRGNSIGARMARDGEKITLLNGKSYELTPDDVVIADADGAIGLGGIMGGGESEVTSETTRIILEVATFDMYTIRKTAMRHGVFTDALTRFNKGQSPLQNGHILRVLMASMTDVSGAKQASNVFDEVNNVHDPEPVSTTAAFINGRLGSSLDAPAIATLLEHVECETKIDDETITVKPPFWRTDIELPEDIVEEVGRLYGFDKLPRELPLRSSAPAPLNLNRELKQQLRDTMARFGANEVLSYSFVNKRVIENAGQDVSHAFQLSNALSPDLQYYRLSILPSLLDKVHMNIKAGFDEFTLFEIGKAHSKLDTQDGGDKLPEEREYLDAVYASSKDRDGAPYFAAKHTCKELMAQLHITVAYEPFSNDVEIHDDRTAPFELTRSARILSTDGTVLGFVGELKQQVKKAFKLPAYVAAMSLDIAALRKLRQANVSTYEPLSRFPSTSRDISIRTAAGVPYESLRRVVHAALSNAIETISVDVAPTSVYQSADDIAHKTTTLHLVLTGHEKTLDDQDIAPILQHVEGALEHELSAQIV